MKLDSAKLTTQFLAIGEGRSHNPLSENAARVKGDICGSTIHDGYAVTRFYASRTDYILAAMLALLVSAFNDFLCWPAVNLKGKFANHN